MRNTRNKNTAITTAFGNKTIRCKLVGECLKIELILIITLFTMVFTTHTVVRKLLGHEEQTYTTILNISRNKLMHPLRLRSNKVESFLKCVSYICLQASAENARLTNAPVSNSRRICWTYDNKFGQLTRITRQSKKATVVATKQSRRMGISGSSRSFSSGMNR
jgi:hypothetical protein